MHLAIRNRARCVLLICFTWLGSASATTYYVDGSRVDDSGNGTLAAPKKFIASGMALLSPLGGDVLQIAAGNYSGANNRIDGDGDGNGQAGSWNIVRASTDGTVRISAGFDLPVADHWLQFEGLVFDSAQQKTISGRYVKVLRSGFRGGPATGNAMNLAIGTNDVTPGAQHVLLEDVYAWGPGGRYNIIVYNADRVVLRRVLVRHDFGWSDTVGDPQANVALYDSTNVLTQNLFLLDSHPGVDDYYEAALYHPSNRTTNVTSNNIRNIGAIIVNIGNNGIGFDGSEASTANLIEDSVIWDTRYALSSNGDAHGGVLNRITAGQASDGGINDWNGGGNFNLGGSILWTIGGSNLSQIAHAGNVCFNPTCSGETALNPANSGLLHLPRIEVGSALASAGAGGTRVGAQVLQRLGVSGSLYGETGFDVASAEALWPWPNEAAIKIALCQQAGVNTGFCAAPTLTRYIWEMLGHPIPPEIYAPGGLFNNGFE
ncbi:MAG: hypothetical protein IPH76_06485 [Xanthomonadales bacterium]|nr:hypothetical protein [Xanthomonadales bacterium]